MGWDRDPGTFERWDKEGKSERPSWAGNGSHGMRLWIVSPMVQDKGSGWIQGTMSHGEGHERLHCRGGAPRSE